MSAHAPDAARLRREGRVAGALYLAVVLAGMFCLAYVPGALQGDGSVAGRFAAAGAQAGLFRAGIAAFLVMQVAFLLLPLALHRVLADAGRTLALLMVVLAVTSVPVGLVGAMHLLDALALLQGNGALPGDAPDAAFAAALQRHGHALRVASLFWGLWLLPFGALVLRSRRLPRVLGVLLVLGGLGYVVQVFGGLFPGFSAAPWLGYVRLPAAVGEIGSCLWLLAFGARASVLELPSQ